MRIDCVWTTYIASLQQMTVEITISTFVVLRGTLQTENTAARHGHHLIVFIVVHLIEIQKALRTTHSAPLDTALELGNFLFKL